MSVAKRSMAARFALVSAAAAASTYLSCPALFRRPSLYCEDGLFFAHYHELGGWKELLWSYNGYVSLGANLLGWATRWFPLQLAPRVMASHALLAGAACYALLTLRRFRVLVRSDDARAVIAGLLALWPLGDFAMAHGGIYWIWHLLLALCLLALAPVGRGGPSEALLVLVQMLCVCSTPLGIVVVPLWAVRLARARRWFARVADAVLIATALAYFYWAVEYQERPALELLDVARRVGFLLGARVFLEALGGAQLPVELAGRGLAWLAVSCGWAVACVLLAVGPRRRLASVAYLIVGLTVLAVVGRGLPAEVTLGAGRFYYVPGYLFLLALLSAGYRLARRARWPDPALAGAACVLALAAALVLHYNRAIWWDGIFAGDGGEVARFLAAAKPDHAVPLRYERGKWSIVLNPPR